MTSGLERREIRYNFSAEQQLALQTTANWAENFYRNARPEMGAHYFDHLQRVAGMAGRLAHFEKYDPFLPVLTALVFDIGRVSNDSKAHTPQHGQVSYQLAEGFLRSLDVIAQAETPIVRAAIEDHPLLNPQVRQSPLVKVLMDADRLGTIGALSPTRAASTRWKLQLYSDELASSTSPHELDMKTIYQDIAFRLPKWYESIWTPTAKIIAKPRQEFLLKYVRQLTQEVNAMHKGYQMLGLKTSN